VSCAGWLETVMDSYCVFVWSDCTDGINRQVLCERVDEDFACRCFLLPSETWTFVSPNFCDLATGDMTIDRAVYAGLVRDTCGFRIGP